MRPTERTASTALSSVPIGDGSTPTITNGSDCKSWRQYQSWGGITQEPPQSRWKAPPERHPAGYVEHRLIIWDVDCTALWHQAARNEMKRVTRHLPQSHQNVALAFVADCTVGGQYYWSETRLGQCAGRHSRETACRAVRRLGGDLEILRVPKKQRHYKHPKTLTLSPWFMTRVRDAVMRALCRGLGHTRKAKPSVGTSTRGAGWPSYSEFVRRFPERRRYRGGCMVRCPAHDDRHPSLSISEGRGGRILLYCHAGCSHERVREKLGLPPPKPKVTLRAAKPQLERDWETVLTPAGTVLWTDYATGATVERPVGNPPWSKFSDTSVGPKRSR
jgi:hypothetical protein